MVIPKPLRDSLGIRAGQRMEIREEAGTLVITKSMEDDPVSRVYGTYRMINDWTTDEFMDEIRGPVELPPDTK
jgi:AbrB family looped-hinge helix DNA binding protein